MDRAAGAAGHKVGSITEFRRRLAATTVAAHLPRGQRGFLVFLSRIGYIAVLARFLTL
ncbi:MAG: hypothetical protein HY608_04935 [Planctomycetes bacterium]|nr:hypothetical protein [Planctomycetota bacterium]